ncbi:hypothetical protein RI129_006328 [Pyrocoelia pectoralis]|uniref:UDP-glucuronosyltransferase n=1 Tax=Pyrocoelia pectoralis TaxID=417401 RepID=A0AAN7VDY5_9COLE
MGSLNMKLCNIIVFVFLIYGCHSARILGIIHIPTHSHQQLGTALLNGLAAKGHEVTMLTPVVPKKISKNLKVVHIKYPPIPEFEKFNFFDLKGVNIFETIMRLEMLGLSIVKAALNSTELQTFLSEDHHFDLVIIEQFINEAFRGFCHHYRAPCITLSTVASNRWTNRQMGNPTNPSYMPELFLPYSDHMNFFQRLQNSIVMFWETLYNHFYMLPRHNELLQKHFPGAPSIYDLYYNTSLILLNSHVAINAPVPLVPNMIPIGGFHINPPNKLPKDLQEYMDDAKDGVIYFSMGSVLNGTDMGEHRINAILNVFRKLKQKILCKLHSDKFHNLPPNVKFSAWFPQLDILAHPNTKLFITHGGLLSTMESTYHGVPIVAIPIFADQELNAANAESNGYAVVVSYDDLKEDELYEAINKVLTNPKYRNTARERSKIFQDDNTKPLDRAAFWVDYVIRHKGAPHLRTAASSLSWYQYLLLDVTLFIITVLLGFLFVVRKLITKLFVQKDEKGVEKAKIS